MTLYNLPDKYYRGFLTEGLKYEVFGYREHIVSADIPANEEIIVEFSSMPLDYQGAGAVVNKVIRETSRPVYMVGRYASIRWYRKTATQEPSDVKVYYVGYP